MGSACRSWVQILLNQFFLFSDCSWSDSSNSVIFCFSHCTAEQGTTGAKARGNGQHASRTTEKVETAQLTESKQHTPKKAEQDVHVSKN